jgi:hypothetical protein
MIAALLRCWREFSAVPHLVVCEDPDELGYWFEQR